MKNPSTEITIDDSFATEVIKQETTPKEKQGMFLLYFRQGQHPHPLFTFFFDSGPFNSIVSRAKDFCETMNYRFVTVRPAITNFEEEIKKLNRNIS